MNSRRWRLGALIIVSTVSLAACSAEDTNAAPETEEATATSLATETAGESATTPADERPIPDVVREAVGPMCGEAARDGEAYNVIAIQGGERCDEAMEAVTEFTSKDSEAVEESEDTWQVSSDWRCGRGTRLEGEPEDAEEYTVNCWDAETRVLLLPQPE